MMTSNYPPDYGISSGATMSLSLKSGTQKFHGGLWEFNRNTGLQRQQLLQQAVPPRPHPVPTVNYNIFGGNIGGPLFIPHVYNTNKRRPSSSGTKSGARSSPAPAPTSRTRIDPADLPERRPESAPTLPPDSPRAPSSWSRTSQPTSYYPDEAATHWDSLPAGCWHGQALLRL